MSDQPSTLECPKMEPLVLGCTWKGFSGNVKTCSIGVEVHKNRLDLLRAAETFNQRRLTVECSTRWVDQAGLFDGEDEQIFEVSGIADTAAMSCSGDKYTFRLTFPKEAVDIEELSNFCSQSGTLTVKDIATKQKPEKEKHPDVEAGKDKPRGQPAFEQLAKAVRETELAKLCHDGTDKPVLSEKLAFAMAQKGYSTLADIQELMDKKPQFWEGELKKVDGMGPRKLEEFTEAYQLHLAQSAPADDSRKLCSECGACYIGEKCSDCGNDFFQAIHDDELDADYEWPLGSCQRETVAEYAGCRAELLLKKCEFGNWHYGVYVIVQHPEASDEEPEGDRGDEYGYQPTLVGNQLDEETARARGLQAVADELIGVLDDFENHDGVKECVAAVNKMLPAD